MKHLQEEAKKPDADPEAVHKIRFYVLSAPNDISKCIQYYDSKKAEAKAATAKTSIKAKHESLVLNIPLLVKDQSSMLSNQVTQVNLVV